MVRAAAARRARARIVSAATPVIAAAHVRRLSPRRRRDRADSGGTVEAGAIARDEILVVALLGEERVRHRQHQRGIGIGTDRHPLRAEQIGRIAT